MIDLIQVKDISLLAVGDRGSTYELTTRESKNYVLIFRKAGSLSGNTYHKGLTYGTSPKTFIFISGEIRFNYRHISSKQAHTAHLKAPCIIEVSPMVTHSVEAMTDISMLECNSIKDLEQDRFREPVFIEDSEVIKGISTID